MDNPFWDYSLAQYGKHGVSEACLTLQDGFGLDVNVLLYAAWLASMGRLLSLEHLGGLESEIGAWRKRVVLPLRMLRRQWRHYPPAESLREEIKRLELRAERGQQARMQAFYEAAPGQPDVRADVGENLRLVATCSEGIAGDWTLPVAQLAALLVD